MSKTLTPTERPDVRPRKPMPSTAGFWIGALFGVLGLVFVVALVAIAVVRTNDHIEAFPRTPIPGAVTVNLDGSTGGTIYVEGLAPLPLAALDLRITSPNGSEILVRPYDLVVRYDLPGSHGIVGYAVGTFRTTSPGSYRIEAAGTAPPGTTLAVGDGLSTGIVGYALGAFVVLLLTVGCGVTLVIVTATRRSRAREQT
jgi:hypothetical protein